MLEIYNELITKIDKSRVMPNEPMSKHTTFRIGGPADVFVKIETRRGTKIHFRTCK